MLKIIFFYVKIEEQSHHDFASSPEGVAPKYDVAFIQNKACVPVRQDFASLPQGVAAEQGVGFYSKQNPAETKNKIIRGKK